MAKLTGPLLSFGASGQIGRTLVVADWKGIKYGRQYAIPANPQTAEQSLTRNTFSLLQSIWLNAPTLFRAPWTANAVGRAYTDRNKVVAENLPVLRGEVDLNNFIASPGALGGPPLSSLAAVAGGASGEIDTTCVAPTPPTDWTLTSVTFIAIPDQDPADPYLGPMVAISDASSAYTADFTGLIAGADYQICAWPVWLRPDGKTAYGPSLIDQATATA